MILKRVASCVGLAAVSVVLVIFGAGPVHAFVLDTSALTDAGEPGTDYVRSLSFALNPPLAPYWANVAVNPALPRKLGMFSISAEETYLAERATQFPDWTYTLEDQSKLNGTLVLDKYQARRGRANSEGVGNAAGALFQAHYVRAATDPTNLTWLQMYRDNTGVAGTEVLHIDPFPNDDGKEKLPFYWRDSEAGELLSNPFSDRPSDSITQVPFYRFVDFQLYLVSYDPAQVNDGTQGGAITIFGGVNWGYEIKVPEPSTVLLIFPSLLGLLFLRRRVGAEP